MKKLFEFTWRCLVILGLAMLYHEITYIADLMGGYIRLLLESGTF